jgi:DNA-binding GntR family transcriptional regulator
MSNNFTGLAPELQKPKPVSIIIYEHLLNAIVTGEIKEDQRIVESELTKVFGVSRSPVREALKMLEIDGLLNLIPYRGVVVTKITPQEVRESLEMKGMVEGFAARIGAQRFGKDIIAELESILEELEENIAEGKLQDVLEANLRFHHKMVEGEHNEKLLKFYEALTNSIRRLYTISLARSTGWKFSLSEHRKILNNIKIRDARAAEHDARQHAFNTIDRVLSLLERKR